MNAQFIAPNERPPFAVIDGLIAEYGIWRTLRAVVGAILARDRRVARRMNYELNAHLQRDIGLVPEVHAPKYWELRL
ncbi:hypothetical protein OU426_01720 [Frigidibacter sp. RF13]|uniref:hypothetical protein n=1 Tax=Frigidibacter sp. RF13 TaxID=2997340 RepID=UPI002271C4A4|nr:hypothetical protein [Frigidibacter sp. RF13]MCY1125559.1 hypothetical protein [Frigidibacter sp. RF13]